MNSSLKPEKEKHRRRTLEPLPAPICLPNDKSVEVCSWSNVTDAKAARQLMRSDIERKIHSLREKAELQDIFDRHCAKVRHNRAKAHAQVESSVKGSKDVSLAPHDRTARLQHLAEARDTRSESVLQRRDSLVEQLYDDLMESGLEENASCHHERLRLQRWARIICAARFLSIVRKAISVASRKERVVRVVTFLEVALTKQERIKNQWKLLIIGTRLRVLLHITRKRLSTNTIRNALRKFRRTSLFVQAIRLFFSRVKKCQRIAKSFISCRNARRELLRLTAEIHFAKCREQLFCFLDPAGVLRGDVASNAQIRRPTMDPQQLSLSAISPRKLSLVSSPALGTATPRKLSLSLISATPRKLSLAVAKAATTSPNVTPSPSARRLSRQPSQEMPSQVWRPLQAERNKSREMSSTDLKPAQSATSFAPAPAIDGVKTVQPAVALPLVQLLLRTSQDDVVTPSLLNRWLHYICHCNQAADMQFRLQLRVHYFDCRNAQIERDRGNHFVLMPPKPKRSLIMCTVSSDLAMADLFDEFRVLLRPLLVTDSLLPTLSERQQLARSTRQLRMTEAGKIFSTHDAL